MSSRNGNPCYGCEKRRAECHATCQEYIKWSETQQAKSAVIKEIRRKITKYTAISATEYTTQSKEQRAEVGKDTNDR